MAKPRHARDPLIVLYDGACGMCQKSVRIAQKWGRLGAYRFVPNDEPEAVALLQKHGLLDASAVTLVVVDADDRPYVRSAAIVQVAKRFRYPYRIEAGLLWVVPRPLRDGVYKQVAKRRRHACQLPVVPSARPKA